MHLWLIELGSILLQQDRQVVEPRVRMEVEGPKGSAIRLASKQ